LSGFGLNGSPVGKFGLNSGGGNSNSSSSGGGGGDLVAGALKESRQQVLNFINIHKIKLENCYICDLCNKQSADNSNMNKHIEFTHANELQAFLQNISSTVV
jgi:hypothetical protein